MLVLAAEQPLLMRRAASILEKTRDIAPSPHATCTWSYHDFFDIFR
jgi:hypothetical protein